MTVHTTHDIAAMVRDAVRDGASVRAVGSGTWLSGGPVAHDAAASTLHPTGGVIAYTPGDLVISVHAGTTMQELADITGIEGQMLALAPYGSPQSTIGAVVATASAAPLAYDDLTVRDLVLGMTVVTGTGDVVHPGGTVVKNVAGFDLVRLHTGAFGMLGILTAVSLRLHAAPHMDHVVTGTLDDAPEQWVPRLIANRAPLPMLVRLAPDEPAQLFARCTGNTARASALRGLVQAAGARDTFTLGPSDTGASGTHETPAAMLRHVAPDALVLRARTQPSHGAALIAQARHHFPEATVLFQPSRGTVRITVPAPRAHGDIGTNAEAERDADARVAAFIAGATTAAGAAVSVVVEQGAAPCRDAHPLDAAIKRSLDPHGVLPHRRAVPPVPFRS